ncbi:uncharacterized protein HLK63_L13387 [Nakaseomyces glabratus]|nr:uncharacterized protein GW608_L13387 [Nakaseomyces glabratus]UCS28405.1 uncharacterized protein HLK63_L13387 [Nakaseomyces glabratus]UCS33634.1 uncharacterized protein HLK64_L13387 [Nakaseomyces glabratus]UCS38863.1 uncharacterized protein HLK62_L13387 [Nakaseomyces glabratus]
MMEGQNISARNSSATAIYYGKIEDKGSKRSRTKVFPSSTWNQLGPTSISHTDHAGEGGGEGGSFKKTHNTHTHTQKRKKLMKRTPFCTVKSVPHVRENTRT